MPDAFKNVRTVEAVADEVIQGLLSRPYITPSDTDAAFKIAEAFRKDGYFKSALSDFSAALIVILKDEKRLDSLG